MRRTAVGLALTPAVLVAVVLAGPSGAHQSDPAVVTVLDAVTPALPDGVRIEVHASVAAQLVVENRTATPLEALAGSGEVFLRVSAAGVAANLGSPSWSASNVPSGRPAGTTPGPARFVRVTANPSWGWFDHRLHPADLHVTPETRNAGRRARLGEWSVPMRYGDVAVTVRGHVEYRPLLGRIVAEVVTNPLPADVELTPVDGRVPGLFLRSSRADAVRILGADGELFAEVRPHRVVVNPRSRVHIEDWRARGREPRLGPAGDGHQLVASSPTYTWLDPRLRYDEPAVPDDVQRRIRPTVLREWTIPIVIGDERLDVIGVTTFVPFETQGIPFEGPSESVRLRQLLAVVLPLLLLAAVIVFRRRATYDRGDRRAEP